MPTSSGDRSLSSSVERKPLSGTAVSYDIMDTTTTATSHTPRDTTRHTHAAGGGRPMGRFRGLMLQETR